MTTFNSIEELKTESQTLQEIAVDYFRLAQKADGELDSVQKAGHEELFQLARQVELLSRIPSRLNFQIR